MKTFKIARLTSEVQKQIEANGYVIVWARIEHGGVVIQIKRAAIREAA